MQKTYFGVYIVAEHGEEHGRLHNRCKSVQSAFVHTQALQLQPNTSTRVNGRRRASASESRKQACGDRNWRSRCHTDKHLERISSMSCDNSACWLSADDDIVSLTRGDDGMILSRAVRTVSASSPTPFQTLGAAKCTTPRLRPFVISANGFLPQAATD